MRFRAPASVRRSSEQRRTHPQAGRTRGTSRPGNERPLIPSGIAGIAAAFIARMLDLNDEIATCVAPKAGAPARHPQSIGPVRCLKLRPRPLAPHRQSKIGSASCREGCCQYVYNSAVDVTLKTKTKK